MSGDDCFCVNDRVYGDDSPKPVRYIKFVLVSFLIYFYLFTCCTAVTLRTCIFRGGLEEFDLKSKKKNKSSLRPKRRGDVVRVDANSVAVLHPFRALS